MKILHSADWHSREKDIEEVARCLDCLVNAATVEQPDLAVVAGDEFDDRNVKVESPAAQLVIRTISELADICPVVLVIGTLSHEGNAPAILEYVRGHFPVLVADRPMQALYEKGTHIFWKAGCLQKPDAVLTLIPQPTKQFFSSSSDIRTSDQEIGEAMSAIFAGFGAQASQYPDAPHILVGHWNTRGSELSNGQVRTGMDIEIGQDQMALAGADLVCLGHIHNPQRLGYRTFYSGSLYATNAGEDHEHGFWIHELSNPGDLIISRYIETPYKRLMRVGGNWTEDGPDMNLLLYQASPEEIAGKFVRVDLKVWQDEAEKVDREAIERAYRSSGALDVDIRIVRVPRETIRAAEVLRVETLSRKVFEMASMKDETVSDSILRKADLLENLPADELLGRIGGAA